MCASAKTEYSAIKPLLLSTSSFQTRKRHPTTLALLFVIPEPKVTVLYFHVLARLEVCTNRKQIRHNQLL